MDIEGMDYYKALEDKGWSREPCYDCNGGMRGVELPEECSTCNGTGYLWRTPKGRLKAWPGGPFLGMA